MTSTADHRTFLAPTPAADWPTELVILQAEDRAGLLASVQELQQSLPGSNDSLAKISYRHNSNLAACGMRLALVADSVEGLIKRLERAESRLADPKRKHVRDVTGIYFTEEPLYVPGSVAILFPGEGAQYLNMLGDLAPHFEEVRRCLEFCDANTPAGEPKFSRFLAPSHEDSASLEKELRKLGNAIFSVLIADWAWHLILESLDLPTDMIAGHSAGELAALWAAGAIPVNGFVLETVRQSMRSLEEKNSGDEAVLLAIGASPQVARELVAGRKHVYVAMDNCPHQTVIVGETAAMQGVEEAVKQRGLVSERLPVSRPYHTELFEPYMGPLFEMFEGSPFQTPPHTIYSCTTAQPFPKDPREIKHLAISHWASPVRFREMIENMHSAGARIFVEAGPRGNLTAFTEDILRGKPAVAVAADLPRRHSLTQLQHMLGQLAVHHVPFRMEALYEQRKLHFESQPEIAPLPAISEAVRPTTSAKNGRSAGRGAVVQGHLQLMEQFLAQQQEMMQSFLQRRPRSGKRTPTADGLSNRSGKNRLPAALSVTPVMRPLIGDILNHARGEQLVMRRRLDPSRDLYATEHTVGGRTISKVQPDQVGLPVGPMTFTLEMMAEVCELLCPGNVVRGIRNVKLHRWLEFNEFAMRSVEVVAKKQLQPQDSAAEIEVQVEVFDLGKTSEKPERNMAAAATVMLGQRYLSPPQAGDFSITAQRDFTLGVKEMYDDLFHGEQFQGVTRLTRLGEKEIEAEVQVLPRDRLFAADPDPQFLLDPVLMDVGMHPLAAWHLEQPDRAGRVLLPFQLERIEFFGPRPQVGAKLQSRLRTVDQSSRHFTHSVELVDAKGRIWCRLTGAKYYRFYLPFGDVNFHGRKDEYFLGHIWPAPVPENSSSLCVRLDPPGDLLTGPMLAVSSMVILSPAEQAEYRKLTGAAKEKADWLFARGAAKDAVRLLWHQRTGERLFPADIEIWEEANGRPAAKLRGNPGGSPLPRVQFSAAGGRYAALACWEQQPGIVLKLFAGEPLETDRIEAARAAVAGAIAGSCEVLHVEQHQIVLRHPDREKELVVKTIVEEKRLAATVLV